MGWILLGAAGFLALSGVASDYSVLDYRMHRGNLPLGPLAVLLQPTWAPAVLMLGLTILLFPDGRLPSRRWFWVLCLVLAAGAAFQLGAFAVALGAIIGHNIHVTSGGDLRVIDNPSGAWRWWLYVEAAFFGVVAVSWLAWLGRELPLFLRSTGELRLQQKWFLTGGAVLGDCRRLLGGYRERQRCLAPRWSGRRRRVHRPAGRDRHRDPQFRLYDIDRVISRTLSYAVVHGPGSRGVRRSYHADDQGSRFPHPDRCGRCPTLAAVALFNPLRAARATHRRPSFQSRPLRLRGDRRGLQRTAARRRRSRDGSQRAARGLSTGPSQPAHASVWIRRRG